MSRVLKYHIIEGITTHPLPAGSEILSAKEQRGSIVVYALVPDEFEGMQIHHFMTVGTGQETPFDGYTFIDTLMLWEGRLVLHVFYKKVG